MESLCKRIWIFKHCFDCRAWKVGNITIWADRWLIFSSSVAVSHSGILTGASIDSATRRVASRLKCLQFADALLVIRRSTYWNISETQQQQLLWRDMPLSMIFRYTIPCSVANTSTVKVHTYIHTYIHACLNVCYEGRSKFLSNDGVSVYQTTPRYTP